MAAAEPEDVTTQYAGDEAWGIPADATRTAVAADSGVYADIRDSALYISFTLPTTAFYGYSAQDYYDSSAPYLNAAGENLMDKYGGEDYIVVTDILFSPLTPYFFKYHSLTYGLVYEGKYEAGKTQTGDSLSKYQNSDFIIYYPNPYIYFLNINNDVDSLATRQKPGENRMILTNLEFRKGISLSMNRSKFLAQQGYGKAMYGCVSDMFIYDVESGVRYRDSQPAIETLSIKINGETVTKTYFGWYNALYSGEYAIADSDVRNQILASMELGLMLRYHDCPFWSASSSSLLGRKVNYPTYDYVNEVAFGGIRFMTCNYTDAEWVQYCADNNNQLNYQ